MDLQYEISLINVNWFNGGNTNRNFTDVDEQKSYFLNKAGGYFSPLVNFKINDGISTIITYYDDSDRSIEDLIHCNYVIVRKGENYRYYFAVVRQLSGRQVQCELELDDIQTNYIKYRSNIKPCLINKAHLNRFNRTSGGEVEFSLGDGSPFFKNYDDNKEKRLINRDKVFMNFVKENDVNEWLNENVLFWVYVFIDRSKEYRISDYEEDRTQLIKSNTIKFYENSFFTDTSCICYPIYKGSNELRASENDSNMGFNSKMYDLFRKINNNTSYFYNIKISVVPPFSSLGLYEIVDGNLISKGKMEGSYPLGLYGYQSYDPVRVGNLGWLWTSFEQPNESYKSNVIDISNIYENVFDIDEIKKESNDKKYNPYYYSSQFMELKVTNTTGESYVYDLLKLNSNKVTILYDELIIPEITKSYIRIENTGLYSKATENSFIGVVSSVDNSLAYDNDKYSEYLSNNKNYWLQSTGANIISGTGSYLASGGSLAYGSMVAGVQQLNSYLNLDNFKNAPSSYNNARGNALFSNTINDEGIYLEYHKCLDIDIDIFNDKCNREGFLFNKIGEVKDFDNIRINHNYISCEIKNINAPLDNDEKERLIQKMRSITLFNNDDFDINKPNYERWLDD